MIHSVLTKEEMERFGYLVVVNLKELNPTALGGSVMVITSWDNVASKSGKQSVYNAANICY